MDFAKAALLIATVYGLTQFVKAIGPASWYDNVNAKVSARAAAITAIGVGQVAVFLVAATVWAHSQVLNGHALDNLNVASKILVGLFVAAPAALTHEILGAVKNVGDNQVQKPVAK